MPQRDLDNWNPYTRRAIMRLYIDKGGSEIDLEGAKGNARWRRDCTYTHAHTYGPEGVIELDAVIQSSQDAVMKLPPSSILSVWHGQLPAALELSKKLRCISD